MPYLLLQSNITVWIQACYKARATIQVNQSNPLQDFKDDFISCFYIYFMKILSFSGTKVKKALQIQVALGTSEEMSLFLSS